MANYEKANILIVDDLPEKLLVYQTVLEELGQNVVAVRSGMEALKRVLKEDYAVILLDVNMPDLDGFETARLIRQRKRSAHTPIIFLTSFADDFRIQQGYAQGAVDYIPAPVIPEILRAKVRVFVELFCMRKQVAQQAEMQARREAAEESAKRSAFLAEASRALASTLDFETTLSTLIRLAVPRIAKLCIVSLQQATNNCKRVIGAWVDQDGTTITQGEIKELPDACVDLATAVLDSAKKEGRSGLALYPSTSTSVDHRFIEEPSSPDRRLLALPLCIRGKILGVMFFGSEFAASGLSPDEWLAEELAGRAAVALENATLLRDIQDADRRKNEFLAMLAHELRNPLAPIRNAVHLLRMNGQGDPKINWARDVIDRQASNLARMVDDLLDVARINEGKIQLVIETVDVKKLISRAIETSKPLIDSHGHHLEISLAPIPMFVRGDSTRLSQVLSNLINNAAKYTADKGRIEIKVEPDKDTIAFHVRDNGAGVPPELLGRIFDLFTQANQSLDRSQGGLGIGLTLVRRIVELHGGSALALSEGAGMGSEFVVRIPSCEPEPECQSPSESDLPSPGQCLRILVVDDNIDVAESLAMILRHFDHEVRLAHDGISALDAAQLFDPHVVFLDIGLPQMDGFEVARRIRADPNLRPHLLIAISGYGQDEDVRKSKIAGFDHHLTKPVPPEVLHQYLDKVTQPS